MAGRKSTSIQQGEPMNSGARVAIRLTYKDTYDILGHKHKILGQSTLSQ